MLKLILVVVVLLVLVLVVFVATRSSDFRIVRATNIKAPVAVVFPHVNDFHKWDDWSPWAKIDPDMKQTHEGPSAGVGAIYSWAGNSKVGEGRMTILDSRADEFIRIKLEFIKPFAAVNITEFTFKADSGQTTVTWDMSGKNNFMSKAFCMFMNMDKRVGGDFEKGLAGLKTVVELTQM